MSELSIHPLLREHLFEVSMNVKSDQKLDSDTISEESVDSMIEDMSEGWSILDDNGKVLACNGVTELNDGSCHVWSLFSDGIGLDFFTINKMILVYLNGCKYRTIWADVRSWYKTGHRWVKALGFKSVRLEHNYYTNGDSALIYRRDKSWQ